MYSATVVVLNWNQFKITLECIKSILNSVDVKVEIILVDNGSNDNSSDKLKDLFSSIELVKIRNNRGFAFGCNYGLKYALNKKSNNIVFISNDTVLDSKCIYEMIKCTKENKNIGMIVPKIYYYSAPSIIWYAGGEINFFLGKGIHYGYKKRNSEKYEKEINITFANGCVFLILRKTLKTVGFFDTRYFSYGEDTDLSIRIINEGLKIIYSPKSILWHRVSSSHYDSLNKSIDTLVYYSIRNAIWLQKKYPNKISQFGSFINVISQIVRYGLRSIIKRDWTTLPMLVKAISHGYCENKLNSIYQ